MEIRIALITIILSFLGGCSTINQNQNDDQLQQLLDDTALNIWFFSK